MASFFTDKGMRFILGQVFNNEAEPTVYYAYLINSTATPTKSLNTYSEVSGQAAVNISANPLSPGLSPNSTDFPSITEGTNEATVNIRSLVFTASGGNMTGDWVIITDDNATAGNRQVIACLDLGGDQTVSSGQTITVSNTVLKLN